jgi:hypothetical protein
MMHMHCFQPRGVLLGNFHSYARIGIRYRSVGKLYSLSFLVILFSETQTLGRHKRGLERLTALALCKNNPSYDLYHI